MFMIMYLYPGRCILKTFAFKLTAHMTEVEQKYNIVLNLLTSKEKRTVLSHDDNGYLRRIDNQLRSMNVSVWHCAATVFALYREFVQPNNLSNEFYVRQDLI